MRKIYHLRSPSDFSIIFRFGRRREYRLFRTVSRENKLTHHRFAFIAPKIIEKRAVVRNKLRRRAQEWIRKNLLSDKKSLDVVIIFKKDAVAANKKTFYEELKETINRIFG